MKDCFRTSALCFILIALPAAVQATTITSQVGTSSPDSVGSLSATYGTPATQGFVGWIEDSSITWTHSYSTMGLGTITSATLTIDILDPDTGHLQRNNGDDLLGLAFGGSSGSPGGWHVFGDGGPSGSNVSVFSLDILDPSILANLQSGSFTIVGTDVGMATWGSN